MRFSLRKSIHVETTPGILVSVQARLLIQPMSLVSVKACLSKQLSVKACLLKQLRASLFIYATKQKSNSRIDGYYSNCEADQRLCFRCRDSAISLLSKSKISSLYRSSEIVQLGLCQTWSEPKLLLFSHTCSNKNKNMLVKTAPGISVSIKHS